MKDINWLSLSVIDQCMACDQTRFQGQLARCQRMVNEKKKARFTQELSLAIQRSYEKRCQREKNVPVCEFNPQLPIVQARTQIETVLSAHQVVIIAGETGSGKTTQLAKICMGLKRGIYGQIGHTQPRRLAARTVAQRIAQELNSPLGQWVGYKVRFNESISECNYIKIMTDGILLAEIQTDPNLSQYDTLIIDEAHERSLNIDLLLGYLKRLLPKRPDLKIIVTSATIDLQRFSDFFNKAPILEVSGQTYPVETHYLTQEDLATKKTPMEYLLEAIKEAMATGWGDILIFQSGQSQIRETAQAISKMQWPHVQVLPLYAKLSWAHQKKIFQSSPTRKIVISTNVAETSLTVPNIRFVIDPGQARVSRYYYKTKTYGLPIEKISQASANQRKGRCGRVQAGICYRLYTQDDFLARPLFTPPEIKRTNLAQVILQCKIFKFKRLEDFPFIDPPEAKTIKDGTQLLQHLGALTDNYDLTSIGRQLVKIPLDPKMGRILLQANGYRCVLEILIIVSALSIPDPRERPLEHAQKADEAHKQFEDPRSDFLGFLNLWKKVQRLKHKYSAKEFKKWCQRHYLSTLRLREWWDIHQQLLEICESMGFKLNEKPATYEAIHKVLLTGFISSMGQKDEKNYKGPRGTRFSLFPGSALAKKGPPWVMCFNILETQRPYGMINAKIDPLWTQEVAPHLLKYHYFEPHWEQKRAMVCAYQKATLFGLEVIAKKKVDFGQISPSEAQAIFIRQALVQGDLGKPFDFYAHNLALVRDLEALEDRVRQRGILADEQVLFEFYQKRLPEHVHNQRALEKHLKTIDEKDLFFDKEWLMDKSTSEDETTRFPHRLSIKDMELPVTYVFKPGDPSDGATITLPNWALSQFEPEDFSWLVEGLREEKILALLKTMSKPLRKHFFPLPQYAKACFESMTLGDPLTTRLAQRLTEMTGVPVEPHAFDETLIDPHLRFRFRIVDENAKVLALGRDFQHLKERFGAKSKISATMQCVQDTLPVEQTFCQWTFGDIPKSTTILKGRFEMEGFVALQPGPKGVQIALLTHAHQAKRVHVNGCIQLMMAYLSQELSYLQKHLPDIKPLTLLYVPLGDPKSLIQQIQWVAVASTFFADDKGVYSQSEFLQRLEEKKGQLVQNANELGKLIKVILLGHQSVCVPLKSFLDRKEAIWTPIQQDLSTQWNHLFQNEFIRHTPLGWLKRFPVYLKAIECRLEKVLNNVAQDLEWSKQLQQIQKVYAQKKQKRDQNEDFDPALENFRWQGEELRVSLYAQQLKTLSPISFKRLKKLWDRLD